MPTYLGLLAEVYEKVDRVDEGLAVVAEALALAEETGAHYWDAELERLRGTLLLGRATARLGRKRGGSTANDPEPCFQRAIEIARRQQAKSLELRAATSLARLWQGQGRTAEARSLLSEVYSWFSEGHETPDAREARSVLEQLDAGARRR